MTLYAPPPPGPMHRVTPLGQVVHTMQHRDVLVAVEVLDADGVLRWVPASEAGL